MTAYNGKLIDTSDVAQRIQDSLSDFHNDGLITGATLRSKTNYTNVIRAINDADREVCRDSQIHGLVVVYVPAETTSIPFNNNSRYIGEIMDALSDMEDIIEQDQEYFMAKRDYIDVVEITDRYIQVFESYPVGSEQSENQIRKVGSDEFFGRTRLSNLNNTSFSRRKSFQDRGVENFCTYMVDENRLLLGAGFDNPRFIRFTARLFPGVINTSKLPSSKVSQCDYSAYRIVSPHTAMSFLVNSAIYHLLPVSSSKARSVAAASMSKEKTEFLKMKPSDRNVVVPHFSFG